MEANRVDLDLTLEGNKIAIISGTRPEAIKLAPVYLALKELGTDVEYIHTGQHGELHDQVTEFFNISKVTKLAWFAHHKDLPSLCSRMFVQINEVLREKKFSCVVVQGDTASAFCGANVAYLNQIPVCHIEAGLRSGWRSEPFPEEAFRKMISVITDIHCCPTEGARNNLIKEGIDRDSIHVTGNTVIDAVRIATETHQDISRIANELGSKLFATLSNASFVLMTVHRRENHGDRLEDICDAMKLFCEQSETHILCPVHPNPNVKDRVVSALSSTANVHLVPALTYQSLVWALRSCKFIVSDSGGLQEEAPSVQKRILILRDQTERPEIVESGWGDLIGVTTDRVVNSMLRLDQHLFERRVISKNPFGDGMAAGRICNILLT